MVAVLGVLLVVGFGGGASQAVSPSGGAGGGVG